MSFILLGVSAGEIFKWIGYVLVALLCLMFMIVVHELGHYLAGKLFKFKISEFSIGFGPAIFKKKSKKSGQVFAVRWLPLGGYCSFAESEAEITAAAEKLAVDAEGNATQWAVTEAKKTVDVSDCFDKKPPWQRIIVLFSGALFNFLSAIIIIAIFFMSFGEVLPQVAQAHAYDDETHIQQLVEGDVILAVDGKKAYSLLDTNTLSGMIKDKDSVTLTVLRGGEELEIEIVKGDYTYSVTDENGEVTVKKSHGLGISLGFAKHKLGFFPAIGHAFKFAFDVIALIFRTFGMLFTGAAKVSESMGGTVTAIASMAQLTQYGFSAIMYGVCVLSASIGIMNLMPIPALDGSKIVLTIIEWIRKKPINKKAEAIIDTVGLVLMFALAITLDLVHFLA